MEFRVLGPVGVVDRGAACRLRPRSAELLAVFLLTPNRAVSRDALIDRLWPRGAPSSAVGSLNVHLHRLRQELGDSASEVSRLARSSHGYTLVVEDGELDSAVFAAGVDRARRLAGVDPEATVAALDAALALWHGRAFGDLDDIDDVVSSRVHLEALRADAACVLADALLESDQLSRVVLEAPGWLTWAPYSEHLASRLALALYRRGDQVGALRCCREFAGRLVDELGLDPTPEFRAIESAILDHTVVVPRRVPPTRPSRLAPQPGRAQPTGLVERDDSMAQVIAALDGAGDTPRVVMVWGEAGVGKTALLRAIGDRLPRAFRLSSSAPGQPLGAVRSLAARLAPDTSLPEDPHPDAITAWLIRLVGDGGPTVVLWDDIERADQDSLAILGQVATRLPITWVTTSRTGDPRDHPLLADRSLLDGVVRIELGALSGPGLAALAATLDAPLNDRRVTELAAQTGGNPFLARALLRSPEWLHGSGTPTTAIEHIRRLVAEVGADASEWYTLAAIDESAALDVRTTCAAMAIDVERGVEVAEGGLAAGLLTERDGELQFRHSLVRESLVAGLSVPRRRVLHERLARVLLGSPGTAVSRVAHHLRASDAPQLRSHAAEFTARQAHEERSAGALLAAADHYLQAADLIDDLSWSGAAAWRLDACATLVLAGRTIESQDLAATVASRIRTGGDRGLFVRAAVAVTGPYLGTGATARRAEAHLAEALEWCHADGADLPAELCEAVARQTTDRTDVVAVRLREDVRPHLERYSEVGSPPERYLGLVGRRHLGWADGVGVAERRRLLTDCLRLAASSGSVHDELRVRWSLASDCFLAADPNALDAASSYASRADEVGSPMHRWISGRLGGAIALAHGDEAEALRHRLRIAEVTTFVDSDANDRAELLTVLADTVRSGQLAGLRDAAEAIHLDDEEFRPLVELARLAIRRAAGVSVEPADVSRHLETGGHGTARPAACALACLCLGHNDRVAAATVGELLAPWSGGMVLLESGFATLGPADAYLARCADLTGDVAGSEYHRDAAEQVTGRLARAWAGWSLSGG